MLILPWALGAWGVRSSGQAASANEPCQFVAFELTDFEWLADVVHLWHLAIGADAFSFLIRQSQRHGCGVSFEYLVIVAIYRLWQ